jgi:hypothetical protein
MRIDLKIEQFGNLKMNSIQIVSLPSLIKFSHPELSLC